MINKPRRSQTIERPENGPCFQSNSPSVYGQIKSKLKPWITSGILKSISKRDFFHRRFVKAKNAEDKARFHTSLLSLIKT